VTKELDTGFNVQEVGTTADSDFLLRVCATTNDTFVDCRREHIYSDRILSPARVMFLTENMIFFNV
jgi:hypothetical protein